MELFFDTETAGFHKKNLAADDPAQTWIVQLGFILSDENKIYQEANILIRPHQGDCSIHPGAQRVHGISLDDCLKGGCLESCVYEYFEYAWDLTDLFVCHNWNFDKMLVADMITRCSSKDDANAFLSHPHLCTMLSSTDYCSLPGRYGKPKWPKLEELYVKLFGETFSGAHDALADVRATRECYYELKRREVI